MRKHTVLIDLLVAQSTVVLYRQASEDKPKTGKNPNPLCSIFPFLPFIL
jgi:hypothetical protein